MGTVSHSWFLDACVLSLSLFLSPCTQQETACGGRGVCEEIRSYFSRLNMAHHDGEGGEQEVGPGCKISGWPTSSS